MPNNLHHLNNVKEQFRYQMSVKETDIGYLNLAKALAACIASSCRWQPAWRHRCLLRKQPGGADRDRTGDL